MDHIYSENMKLTFKEENRLNFIQRQKMNKNMQFGADADIHSDKTSRFLM